MPPNQIKPPDISVGAYRLTLAAVAAAALLLHAALVLAGFYRVEADESARSLMAWELSWRSALEPWVWPPFYKIVVGLFLKLQGDIFLGPRILVALAATAIVLVLAAPRPGAVPRPLGQPAHRGLGRVRPRPADLRHRAALGYLLSSRSPGGEPVPAAMAAGGPRLPAAARLPADRRRADRPVRGNPLRSGARRVP